MAKRHQTAVIGLGNLLLADEGVGLHAVDRLKEKLAGRDLPVDVVAAGTGGMALLHEFTGRKKIIFLDAGNCGVEPGRYRRFLAEDAVSVKGLKGHSLHEFDLMGLIEFARALYKEKPFTAVIYCVQPVQLDMSENLSPAVSRTLPFLVEDVYNEIERETTHA